MDNGPESSDLKGIELQTKDAINTDLSHVHKAEPPKKNARELRNELKRKMQEVLRLQKEEQRLVAHSKTLDKVLEYFTSNTS